MTAPLPTLAEIRDDLERHASLERAKRFAAVGLLLVVYGIGWLVVGARASRFAETVCRIERVPSTRACAAVHHTNDGQRHTSVWDSCEKPARWPLGPIGGTLRCFYWVSDPGQIVFTQPRRASWARPEIFALSALGLLFVGEALWLAAQRRRRSDGEDHDRAPQPYRDPPPADPSGHRPSALLVPVVASTHVVQKIVGVGLLLSGGTLGLALLLVAPRATGHIGLREVGVVLLAHAATFVGVLGIGYRSGLVVDPDRGVLSSFWGIFRPMFHVHAAISDVTAVGSHEVFGRYGFSVKSLRITFSDGRTWSFQPTHVDTAVPQIRSAIAAAGPPA